MRRLCLLLCLAAAASSGFGCFGFKTVNAPLSGEVDPEYGYRPSRAETRRDRGDTAIYLAFSGGGTRAAAMAYGVMQGLRETLIETDSGTHSMLDEVDTISGVSGGSFPAAYYGLFQDRIFDEFEPRFLRRNIQGAILWRALIPWNTIALLTPWLSRSEIAEGIYHKSVFDEATFQTLTEANGPVIYINATDLASGERFTFSQGMFDLICSDLQALPISYAVAASSAVPMLLSPISLRSRAGTCGYEIPSLLKEGLEARTSDPRRYRAAKSFTQLHDKKSRFLHLVDGGIADNLGLRAGIDILEAMGSLEKALEVMNLEMPDQLVVISVNAETNPNRKINLSGASPGFAATMGAVSGGQIRRYNFETLLLTHQMLKNLEQAETKSGQKLETFMVEVGFERLPDAEDQRRFKGIATSFKLSDDEIDDLIWVGRDLLLASPAYQDVVRELNGTLPDRAPHPDAH